VVTLLLLARRYGSLLGGQHCGITRNGGKFILKADIQGHLSDSWVRVEHQRNHLSVMFVFFFELSNVIFTQPLTCLLLEIVKIIKQNK